MRHAASSSLASGIIRSSTLRPPRPPPKRHPNGRDTRFVQPLGDGLERHTLLIQRQDDLGELRGPPVGRLRSLGIGLLKRAFPIPAELKPALEWAMERQCVKTDKASGIVNDANRYAIETVCDSAYPLKLFQRVITVSLETMKIVRALPRLDLA